MGDTSKETVTIIAAEVLEEKRKSGAVDTLKLTGKWRALGKEAIEHFVRNQEISVPLGGEMFTEEFWEGLEDNQLREGNKDAKQYWQAKKFTFQRENGKQRIEERVMAHADAKDILDSEDRSQQLKVIKDSKIFIIQDD